MIPTTTIEDVRYVLKGLAEEELSGQRDIVIRTGSKGAQIFHDAMTRAVARDCLKSVDITPDDYARLLEMIESPDMENLTVAMAIIDTKPITKKSSGFFTKLK